jgi:phosphatidate cytidylyltransferase
MRSGLPSTRVLLILLASLALARWLSFPAALWLLALLSFAGLREYLSLADLRPEDRLAMLAAYLSIPFLFILVQVDWYGFFIVSIPVYIFVVLPFFVALGGREARGSVFSVGAIDFGVFLFVYCIGHLAYLTRASVSMALLLVLGVALCDLIDRQVSRAGGGWMMKLLGSAPPLFLLTSIIGKSAGLPGFLILGLALLMPILVLMGNFTLSRVEEDLGIDPEQLEPGRGRMIDGLRAQLFAAPVIFHVLRYFTDIL